MEHANEIDLIRRARQYARDIYRVEPGVSKLLEALASHIDHVHQERLLRERLRAANILCYGEVLGEHYAAPPARRRESECEVMFDCKLLLNAAIELKPVAYTPPPPWGEPIVRGRTFAVVNTAALPDHPVGAAKITRRIT